MDAFDADVLIYAAVDDPRGIPIRTLMQSDPAGIGSVLLIPELLSHPLSISEIDVIRADSLNS